MASKIFKMLTRRKIVSNTNESEMNRCLSLTDLTALGVGATLGLGIYVLAGAVARTVAGPAVCLSFLVAAVASGIAALCYAEFAARVPKAGSAYVYSYVTVGELVAFIIGWNLILEYVIGTASVARGLSNYIDALADKKIREAMRSWAPIDVNFLSDYPDFLAFGLVLVLTALLAFGVKESTRLNNAFTILNLATVCIVLVSGAINADVDNWKIAKEDIPEEYRESAGNGGFAPFGFGGIMAGAAKCFYGFVGFDAVATTGEEAKNPQRNIPLAICISLFIIFCSYFGISTVLTMMWPYYDQDVDAPFPYVFEQIGWIAIKWIVTVGAVFALCTSLLGSMFPLPRVIYAMTQDGILFKPLGRINHWTQTPLLATILAGLFAGTMAAMFDLEQLIDMMSIGTLLAYTIVAICVLVLRFQMDEDPVEKYLQDGTTKFVDRSLLGNLKELFNLNNNKQANTRTSRIVNWSIILFSVFTALLCALLVYVPRLIFVEAYYLVAFLITVIAMLVLLTVMLRQPAVEADLFFKVPLVPLTPCISVIFNLYLMMQLDINTWIRFVVWIVAGLLIYFLYGIRFSNAGKPENNHKISELEKRSESEKQEKSEKQVESGKQEETGKQKVTKF